MRELVARPWLTPERVANPLIERARPHTGRIDHVLEGAIAVAKARLKIALERPDAIVAPTLAQEAELKGLSDPNILAEATRMRRVLIVSGFTVANVARVFALVRETTHRKLGFGHYPVQLMGGFVMVRGKLAEMATGEGKTITALLAAATAALAGIPVHVVTVNDYLAARDAEQLRPIYEALGITVGLIQNGIEPPERRAAYAAEVVYCNNKELTFDYLRDSVALGVRKDRSRTLVDRLIGTGEALTTIMRGLHFAIVDEADSVLIDEARTPLIISRPTADADASAVYMAALDVARSLRPDTDYSLLAKDRVIRLTDEGREKADLLRSVATGAWQSRCARVNILEKALSALHLFHLDQQYIIADGKVQIVDEYTGRVMADRQWEQGLHQLIEVKEGVEQSGGRETLAQITYQRFFRKYLWIAGMSGTVIEVARELHAVYGLQVVRIPTNRPVVRRDMGSHVYADDDTKWQAVLATAREVCENGRPVLIGTRSVQASEHIGRLLAAADIPHVILNARQDQEEAEFIAAAGLPGRITVATNIAGRGTDIKLTSDVRDRGGLHVILTEYHDSRRVDRQLFGRAGRQGDCGSVAAFASLDDEIFTIFVPKLIPSIRRWIGKMPMLPRPLGWSLQYAAQARAQWMNARLRSQTYRNDIQTDKALAFGRKPD